MRRGITSKEVEAVRRTHTGIARMTQMDGIRALRGSERADNGEVGSEDITSNYKQKIASTCHTKKNKN